MSKERIVGKLKQARGINTREKIIEAAERYFSEYGYYDASIRKLAIAADVSIGSFYFYFKDKDELLLEVSRRRNDRFIHTISESLSKTDQYKNDRKVWLHAFIMDLINSYGKMGKLRRELKALSYENPRVAEQRKLQNSHTVELMFEYISKSVMINDIKVRQPQTALLFTIDIVDAAYDMIESEPDFKEAVIDECADAIYKYLFL
jgi:AcrR family transcriptional regulator